MAGIRFRTYNAATSQLAELAGMVPVRIEATELIQALTTGRAEAFVSSAATGFDRKVWEHLSYFYDVQGWLPRNYMLVNQDGFDALGDHARNCLRAAALLAEVAGTARARALTDWYRAQLAANGMVVRAPGQQLAADLAAIGATMSAEWSALAGPDAAAILEAFGID